MKRANLVFLLTLIISCTAKKDNGNAEEQVTSDAAPSYRLEMAWASDTLLRTPESVLFDRDRQILYVSNINSNPWEKDGNGFISKMDLSGNIIELEWITGLSAPKGMGLVGNDLYIADIDEIVKADAATGEVLERITVAGKPDLNDITVGADGTVYVSGSSSNSIYALKDGHPEVFIDGDDERYNGLYWEQDRLLLITSGSSLFKAIDWGTKAMTVLAENMGHGDGIVPVGDGGYLTTSWAGQIFHIAPDGTVEVLLDTEANEENAADLDYSPVDKLVFIPTFFDNRVKAYRLVAVD